MMDYDSYQSYDPLRPTGHETEDELALIAERRYALCPHKRACDRATWLHGAAEQTFDFMRCENCKIFEEDDFED